MSSVPSTRRNGRAPSANPYWTKKNVDPKYIEQIKRKSQTKPSKPKA